MSTWKQFTDDLKGDCPKNNIPIMIKDPIIYFSDINRTSEYMIKLAPHPTKYEGNSGVMYNGPYKTKAFWGFNFGRNDLGPPYNSCKFEWRELNKNEMMAYL